MLFGCLHYGGFSRRRTLRFNIGRIFFYASASGRLFEFQIWRLFFFLFFKIFLLRFPRIWFSVDIRQIRRPENRPITEIAFSSSRPLDGELFLAGRRCRASSGGDVIARRFISDCVFFCAVNSEVAQKTS